MLISASIGCRTGVGHQNEDEFAGDFVGRRFIVAAPSPQQQQQPGYVHYATGSAAFTQVGYWQCRCQGFAGLRLEPRPAGQQVRPASIQDKQNLYL